MRVTVIKSMLMAQDMDRAVAFYRNSFAFDPKSTSEHWSELSWKDAVVALHGGHDGTLNRTCLSIEVDDIVSATSAVVAHGGRVQVEAHRREGEPIIYSEFVDPEGNVVMLTQSLGEDEVAAADLLA